MEIVIFLLKYISKNIILLKKIKRINSFCFSKRPSENACFGGYWKRAYRGGGGRYSHLKFEPTELLNYNFL